MEISPHMIGIIGFIALLVLMVLRVPVVYCLLVVGLVGMAVLRGWNAGIATVVATLFHKFASFSFAPVPLFILMGYLAGHSGIMDDLFDAAKSFIGHYRAGLLNSALLGGAAFGCVCGGSSAAAPTLSRTVIPVLLKNGTERKLAIGCVSAASILSPLIPPSTVGMLVAVLMEVSIGRVLIGGIGPGLLFCGLWILYTWHAVKKNPSLAPISERCGWKERCMSLTKVVEFMIIMMVVVVGIYTGFFSTTEAGAVASAAIMLTLLFRRRLTFELVMRSLRDTADTLSTAFIIIGSAFTFGAFLTLTKLPAVFARWISTLAIPPILIMTVIVTFYLIMGMFMGLTSIIYITVPVLAPVVSALEYDLVWFSVLLLVASSIGSLSPPFGNTLFAMKATVENTTLSEVYAAATPYTIVAFIGCYLCVFFPIIIMFLPNTMRG